MKEKLSAMLDGAVDGMTARALFIRLKYDKTFRNEWDSYCLLGDIIRGYAPPEMEGFTERVMARLENEPTIFAPQGRKEGKEMPRRFWRHRLLLPVAASVMGVLAVGGVVAALSRDAPAPVAVTAKIAKKPATASSIRATNYLAAHSALTGGPMPAAMQYVRTAPVPPGE
ncbi:MAG: sigma-E factor negative regulatory protein [Azoarcus sp.]|jgi:sigma-E factor negative regulatory protein RseA|nr:sigma-E factor negative regulatory protein [Azoarcus sp.]